MATRTQDRLYRAVLVDENGKTVIFLLRAPDPDTAAEQAELCTGHDCVIVDDVEPRRRRAA